MVKTAKERHLDALDLIYGIEDKDKFYRIARRIECKMERLCSDYTHVKDMKKPSFECAIDRLSKLVMNKDKFKADFYGNTDPRGYILKLTVSWRVGLQTDGGGYVIIAPEF